MDGRPYWFPVLNDADYLKRLREAYPGDAHLDDDDLRHKYTNDPDARYVDVWDHLGDAREDWEQLADHFLEAIRILRTFSDPPEDDIQALLDKVDNP
jgi:hypothetical protein